MRIFILGLVIMFSFHLTFSQQLPEKVETDLNPVFIAIIVSDMDESTRWYSDILGFEVMSQNEIESRGLKIANLASGKAKLELIQISSSVSQSQVLSNLPPKTRLQGFFKFGFEVNELEPVIQKLKTLDPEFNESIVQDTVTGQNMIVFKDPDGNRIQLFEK